MTNLDKMVEIWNIKSRSMVSTFKFCGHSTHSRAITGTHDSKYLFFCKVPGEVIAWNTET